MKTLTKHIVPFIFVLLAFACTKLPEETNEFVGKEICFQTSVEEDAETKLLLKFWESYVYPGWEDGDNVKIVKWKESASAVGADYTHDLTNDSWNAVSTPIRWDAFAAHDFCVVYPSSAEVTPLTDPSAGSEPEARVLCEIKRNMSNGDPSLFYMVGVTHADEPRSSVRFRMTPAVSVFRFSIKNNKAAGLRIASVNLLAWNEPSWTSSSQQMNIYGKYYVDVHGDYGSWAYLPKLSYAGLAETPAYKSMTPAYSKTMALGETASFTVYAIPQNYKRLVLTLNLTGAVTKEQKIDFINTYNPAEGFKPFHKYDLSVTLQ